VAHIAAHESHEVLYLSKNDCTQWRAETELFVGSHLTPEISQSRAESTSLP
jgi:hypothetical protein